MSTILSTNRFVAAVEAIYAAAPEPSLWPRALQAIADVFSDVGAVLMHQRDDGSFGTIVSPALVEAQNAYQQHWWQHDIRSFRAVDRGHTAHSDMLTDRHVVTLDEIASHPIYVDFLIPRGLGWFAGAAVSPDPRIQVWISIQRASARPFYSDDELAIVARLSRHIEKSLRLSIRLLDAEQAKLGLGEALARLGIGVFALDSLKRVVFANPAGERLLGDGDGVGLVKERLLVGDPPGRVALESAIVQMIRAEPADITCEPKPILIQRQKAARPLAVYVLPVAGQTTPTAQFLTHTRAIVLMIDPIADEPADPAVVRDVLGLTLGEARVAALIGAGVAPREAAAKLGITEESTRTTLKRVFAKTGVSRQSELAALLTKLVLR